MALIITAQPTAEPVTVDEVKARLRLTTTDDDAVISSHISTAREFAESVTGWSLAAKSYRMVEDNFPYPGQAIKLLRPPLVSVVSIQFIDDTYTWQTWDPSEYWIADANVPALVVPKRQFTYPCPERAPGSVRIDFTTDAFLYRPHIEGIRELAVHLYDHPEAVTAEGLKEIPTAFTAFFKSKRAHCLF